MHKIYLFHHGHPFLKKFWTSTNRNIRRVLSMWRNSHNRQMTHDRRAMDHKAFSKTADTNGALKRNTDRRPSTRAALRDNRTNQKEEIVPRSRTLAAHRVTA
ncbi:hypothetical protein BV898_19911 [Hypsibius exemplaris]|uniref:Uncharacterized protein n=1 Tax=Hypsibius exemplaris TaxID=2072580 RepID=A0A9X6NJX6_HYPEX|nr:hypothetical protein BV898_19911 [Hypsibius exemplaris]